MENSAHKKWWFLLLAILLVGALGNLLFEQELTIPKAAPSTIAPDKEPAEKDEPAKTEEPVIDPTNEPTVSKAEFVKIKYGMTYKEITEIIGSEGEILSESGKENTAEHKIFLRFDGEGEIGAYANFSLNGGTLKRKSQYGLK